MKILVTGSNGFLGTATVKRLLEHGERDLRCFVRPGSRSSHLVALGKQYPGANVEIFVGNFMVKEEALAALDGVDVVYHLAAAMKGAPADMFMGSVVASQRLIDAAVAKKKPTIVLVSSFAVYDVGGLPKGGTVTEETPMDPRPELRDVYSHAKIWQERVFWEARAKHGLPLIVTRPGVVYGKGGNEIASKVGMNMFGFFFLFGGDNPLPITQVDNCAEAIVLAGMKGKDGDIYNVSDDDIPTCAQWWARYQREVRKMITFRVPFFMLKPASRLLEWYCNYSEGQLPLAFTPYKVDSLWKNVGIDNGKLRSLGWKPLISTDDALRETFADFREQYARG